MKIPDRLLGRNIAKRFAIFNGWGWVPPPRRAFGVRERRSRLVAPTFRSAFSCFPIVLTWQAESEIETAHFVLALDPKSGAICRLRAKKTASDWALPEHPLALFTYQTLSQADDHLFIGSYIVVKTWWAPMDFGKPHIEQFGCKAGYGWRRSPIAGQAKSKPAIELSPSCISRMPRLSAPALSPGRRN